MKPTPFHTLIVVRKGNGVTTVNDDLLGLSGREDIYDVNYIFDCVEANDLLPNLSEYRLNEQSRFEEYNPCDILLGYVKWGELSRVGDQTGVACSDFSDVEEAEEPVRRRPFLKQGRMPYTRRDRRAILEFIVRKKLYNLLKGKNCWKNMEVHKVCRGRTWQSMKEHFRKQILPQISTFDLTQRQVSRLKRAWAGENVSEDSDSEEPAMTRQNSRRRGTQEDKTTKQNTAESDSSALSDHDSLPLSSIQPRRQKSFLAPSSSSSEGPPTPSLPPPSLPPPSPPLPAGPGAKKSAKHRLFTSAQKDPLICTPQKGTPQKVSDPHHRRRGAAGVERSPQPSTSRGIPHQRPEDAQSPSDSDNLSTMSTSNIPYTREEDEAIVNYIVENGYFNECKGRGLWVAMENKMVVRNRTWQSMKNRFIRYILPKSGVDHFKSEDNDHDRTSRFIPGAYTREEDVSMLNYIVANRRFDSVKGNALWKLMEERGVCEGRTWQSMKNRCLRTIFRNLDDYDIDETSKIYFRNYS